MDAIRGEELLTTEAQALRSDISNLERRQKNQKKVKMDESKFLTRVGELRGELKVKEDLLEIQHKAIKELISTREKAFHPVWGELMRTSLEKSRFGKQIESYACLYTSRVSSLRFYSCSQKMRSYRDLMPHDL